MPNCRHFIMLYLEASDEGREILAGAYSKMVADGTAKTTFYDGTVTNAEEFVADLLRPGSLPFLLFWEKSPAGIAWFNSIEGRSARGHFVLFRNVWGRERTVAIGRGIFTHILTRKDGHGYLFDVLLGLTPARNALAWRLGLACGAKEVGNIPHGAFNAETGKTEDAKLYSVTRASLGIVEE